MAHGFLKSQQARALHTKAAKVVPPIDKPKPTTLMVGVLALDKSPSDELTGEDFLWVKCHGKISAQIIREQFERRMKPNQEWFLHFESNLVPLTTRMADLKAYDDPLIVFEAVTSRKSHLNATRQPLQPLQPTHPQTANCQPPALKANSETHLAGLKIMDQSLKPSLVNEVKKENDVLGRPPAFNPGGDRPQRSHRSIHPSPSGTTLGSGSQRTSPMQPGPQFGVLIPPTPPFDIPASMASTGEAVHSTSPAESHSITQPDSDAITNDAPVEDDIPGSSAEIESENDKSFQLQALLKEAGPQMLEHSVEEGVTLLEDLKAPLMKRMRNHPDAEQWIQQIDNLKSKAVKTKTVIGVVGNTGAGKSSVINAMLDEERLVPTNCMRACTAVVTEISYNYEKEPYRAQVEFIAAADWEKELRTLFQDLLDGDGRVSRDCTNEDTDAGIAYAKIKAVYPKKTKEDIAKSSIEGMLQEVSHILGSTKHIKETNSLVFYKKLQNYVDSKEKSTGKKDDKKKKEPWQIEFWPLIRVVRIHVKSPALATGAVIVDLPGVHDANAARAAVAEGYMKQCTGLWIVAPINRAVDDKAAKSLLGESFKRQLKMDGGFNAVTFICSKTDDISLEEAQDSLGLDDEMGSSWEEMDQLVKKQRSIEEQVKELQASKTLYGESINDADEQIDIWDVLKDEFGRGKRIFAPKPKSAVKKRKNNKRGERPRKKRRTSDSDEDESDFIDDDTEESADESAADTSSEESEQQEALAEDQITAKLQELRATKREARTQRSEILEKIRALKQEMDAAKEAEDNINSEMSALCISGRNQYSKGAIQQDFAAGIKELDQELAAEEDEENFNPDNESRDYDEVARSLPVFCVSSRGYQKLQGRLRKDPPVPGFTALDETEIPQLQAHCEKLTEIGRSANCRSFINKLNQLLNSLVLWASSDGTGANLTPEQRKKEDKYLQKGLRSLETNLENAVKSTCGELTTELEENVFDKYETAVSHAAEDAISTVLLWGSKVNRENRELGGYCWATYKAICRRYGVYSNAQGPHEWNGKLIEPMMKVLASGWEKTFTRRLPMVMASFVSATAARLRHFHREIETRARKIGTSVPSLHMLQQQVAVYETNIKDLSVATKDKINTAQKDINREFIPVIARAMGEAYLICAEERGMGSFARMKAAMNSHIAQERLVMFRQSADEVKDKLTALIRDVKAELDDKVDEIFIHMQRDYRSILGGEVPQQGELLPKTERLVRKEMLEIIESVEKKFRRVAGLESDRDDGEGKKTPELPQTSESELERNRSMSTDPQLEPQVPTVKQEASHADESTNPSDLSASATANAGPSVFKEEPMETSP